MISLQNLLNVLDRCSAVRIYSEDKRLLFQGAVWAFDKSNKYMLSCPIVSLDRVFNVVIIVIAYA